MSDLAVQRVATYRQRKQFLEFPWTLYRDDPNWIPPLRISQKELVGYAPHPFYERNRVQTFLALRGGEVCGRIAAILNQGHNERYRERRGFFGFFECVDDQEAADGLLDAVRQWFADQGIYCLRGPTNPSLNYEVGMLIDGFDSPPTFMMTYNPPYYARLLENYGFRKTQDLYAFWGHIDMLPKIRAKLGPVAEQIIERYNVRLRPMDTSRFLEEVRMFLSIYNRSLVNTWGFVPMSRGRGGPHGGRAAAPDRARTGHGHGGGRPGGRRHVRPARLQPADSPDRRPAVSHRAVPPPAAQGPHQADPPHLDQRHSRVPAAGPGPGADQRHRSQGAGLGGARGGVFLGAGIQFAFPRGLAEGRRQAHQDLSALRPRRSRPAAAAWQPKTASLVRPAAAAARQPLEIRPAANPPRPAPVHPGSRGAFTPTIRTGCRRWRWK